jgi:membrane fusion protein, macrolide-specific efflux system
VAATMPPMRFWRRARLSRAALLNGVLGLLLVGGIGWAYFQLNGAATPAQASTRTVAVAQGTVAATVTASGSVGATNTRSAAFTTAGTVTEIRVTVGEVVSAGQVLATVDATEAGEQLDMAQANRTAARSALTRAKSGGNEDSIANAQNQLDQAESAVEKAQRTVDGTVLKAPMAGTIVAVNGAVGGSSGGSSSGGDKTSGASTGSSGFMQLADLTKLQVTASVPEADATRLKLGQVASVSWNALTGARATGKVWSISPTASSGNVVTYPITVTLDSIPEGARLGQTINLTVTVAEVTDAIYVPAAAVRTAGGRTTVTVVADGQQEVRTVEVGLAGDSYTQVLSGLTVGEQVALATVTSTTNQQPGGGNFPGGGPLPGGGLGGPR